MGEYAITLGIIIDIIISQYVNVWWMTLKLINIGSKWSLYPNSLVYVKYILGCIVCISSGYLNLIWFILAHVICTCMSLFLCPRWRNKSDFFIFIWLCPDLWLVLFCQYLNHNMIWRLWQFVFPALLNIAEVRTCWHWNDLAVSKLFRKQANSHGKNRL